MAHLLRRTLEFVALLTPRPEKLAKQADEAAARGDLVFTPRLGQQLTALGSPEPVNWGPAIAAVENAGWRLEHWAVSEGPHQISAFPVFRRVQSDAQT